MEALDSPAKAIGKAVRDSVGRGPLKDALSGTWLGHPVHPMLTDVVIGSFTSASLLDLFAEGAELASERLIGLGLLAYLPTAAAGVNDWADTEVVDDGVRRVGLVHASCPHRGCARSEGTVEGDEVVCACHGSRFSLRDGAVRYGPAAAAQPAFQVRVQDGRIEVRRLMAG